LSDEGSDGPSGIAPGPILPPDDYPSEVEFDYRSDDTDEGETGLPNLLARTDAFLEEHNAKLRVREHIPLMVVLAGIRYADQFNSRAHVHTFGPGIPFRYVGHLTQLGASGTDKGATVEQFYRIIGRGGPTDPAVFPTDIYKGGSLEALRGGVTSVDGTRTVKFGAVQRVPAGFIYVPEFTQVADLSDRSAGAIQSLLAWADTGEMSYETISGAKVTYNSYPSMIVALQTARLTEVESVVLGWNRRSIYDLYLTPTTSMILPENRPVPRPLDTSALLSLRADYRTVLRNWNPELLDLEEFDEWLSNAYKTNAAVAQDEQMLYSIGIAHHMVSGGRGNGVVRIGVSEDLDRILRQILWHKRIARVSLQRRVAQETILVLDDPYVLGTDVAHPNGQTLYERDVIRIVAARLSIGESEVLPALVYLDEKGEIERIDANGKPAVRMISKSK
jgi:hypothetical protein